MSDRWWEKRRKDRHSWFHIFREFNRMEKMMDEMMRRAFSSFRSPFEEARKGKRLHPRVYGFSITIGPDGTPRIREFGNVKKGRFGPQVREQREPLVDVLLEGEEVVVVAELPGVEKEDINLQASEQSLTISVNTPQRKYHRELDLPEKVDSKSARASYRNGVLEVRLKKQRRKEENRIRVA